VREHGVRSEPGSHCPPRAGRSLDAVIEHFRSVPQELSARYGSIGVRIKRPAACGVVEVLCLRRRSEWALDKPSRNDAQLTRLDGEDEHPPGGSSVASNEPSSMPWPSFTGGAVCTISVP